MKSQIKNCRSERSTYWQFVINIPYGFSSKELESRFDSNLILGFKNYIYILHDKDLIPSDSNCIKESSIGIFKTPHYHILVQGNRQMRKSGVLAHMQLILNIPLNCISVRSCSNPTLAVLYMVHKIDSKDKYPYGWDCLRYSNYSFFASCVSNDSDKVISDYLFSVLNSTQSYEELVNEIGLSFAMKYNKIIYMFYYERNHNRINEFKNTNRKCNEETNL